MSCSPLAVASIDQDVVVIFGHKAWFLRIAPGFGVEMQADHQIGFELFIDDFGPGADFTAHVKQSFRRPLDGGLGRLAAAGFAGEPGQCFILEIIIVYFRERAEKRAAAVTSEA